MVHSFSLNLRPFSGSIDRPSTDAKSLQIRLVFTIVGLSLRSRKPQLVGQHKKSITTNWGNKKNLKKITAKLFATKKTEKSPANREFFAGYSQR
jgi:hypothetical protein